MNSPLKIEKFSEYYHYNHNGDYSFFGHSHNKWEINYVSKGSLQVTYDDSVINLRKNMLFICEANVFHRSRVMSDEGAELFVYQFYTDAISHSKTPRIYLLDAKDVAIVDLIEEEAEKSAIIIKDGALRSSSLNYQATKLLEILLIRLTEAEKSAEYESHPNEKLYRAAVNFMKENVFGNIHIKDIADHCHVSPTKIKTVFAEFTGEAIMTHFYNMKINVAKRFLDEGKSVGDVSNMLGYSSQGYFCNVFKKITGVVPKDYKKTN